jgi:peptidoglycan hydrolase-like protein with peptidoglycan-binding domain
MTSLRLISAAAVLAGASVLVAGCGFGGDTTTVTVVSTTGGASDLAPTSTTSTTGTTTTATTSTSTTATATTGTTSTTPPAPKPNPVKQANMNLQKDLTTLGFYAGPISGVYGPQTTAAVSRFQKAAQLPVDGIAGQQTWAAINLALGNPNTGAVELLQTALTGLCYYDGSIDGVAGAGTEAALIAFQKQAGIKPDGRYGPATATALAKAWPGRPSSCSGGGSGGGGNVTGETATLGGPSLRRTFDLSSCTVVRGTIEATGSSGSINLGVDTEGGPGAQVVVKGGGYGLQGNITKVAISSNGQFRMSGTWGNNNQAFNLVGTCAN